MNRIPIMLICIALAGCQQTTVGTRSGPASFDLNVELADAKARLAQLLPADMHVSRAEVLHLDEGKGILLHAFPRDANKAHPSFALFLWPSRNPENIAYETGEGAHTFRRIGSSERFRVYYSDPSGFLKERVQQEFCTKEKR